MFICIDLGGSNLRGTWIEKSGRTGEVVHVSRPRSLESTKNALAGIVNQLAVDSPQKVQKIGLASAGPMDFDTGQYLNPTNMPELKGFNVRDFLFNQFGLEVVLENDAQASALGEVFRGCLTGESDAMVFTLGTGLGSGVVIDSRIWRGKLSAGPELGHLYLGPGRNVRCGCGQVGCAETWLNARALMDLTRSTLNLRSLKELDSHLEQRDPGALKALDQYGRRLGIYLSQVVSIFGITAVGLSGGLSRLAPYFTSSALDTLNYRLARRTWLIPKSIKNSPDPEMSALWGMCHLILNK